MFEQVLNTVSGAELPEIKTDVGSDLDAVIKGNATGLAIGGFIVIVLAIVVALWISKKIS